MDIPYKEPKTWHLRLVATMAWSLQLQNTMNRFRV